MSPTPSECGSVTSGDEAGSCDESCDESCDCVACVQKNMFSELNETMRDAHEEGRMDLGVFVAASAKLQGIYDQNERMVGNVYKTFSFELAFGAPKALGLFVDTRVAESLEHLGFCAVVLKKRRAVEQEPENKRRSGDYTAGVSTCWLQDFLWLYLRYQKALFAPVWVMVLVGYESDEKKIWELVRDHVQALSIEPKDIFCLGSPEETVCLATICRHSKSASGWLGPSLVRGVKRDLEHVAPSRSECG